MPKERRITVRIEDDMARQMDEMAASHNARMSVVVRALLQVALMKYFDERGYQR